MFSGLDLPGVGSLEPADMTWEYLGRLRDIWPRKLVIKGIVTREDALLAIEHGAVGIGRPYIGGLASFGQEGVERVLEILQAELAGNMRQAGVRSVGEIDAAFVVDKRRA